MLGIFTMLFLGTDCEIFHNITGCFCTVLESSLPSNELVVISIGLVIVTGLDTRYQT